MFFLNVEAFIIDLSEGDTALLDPISDTLFFEPILLVLELPN